MKSLTNAQKLLVVLVGFSLVAGCSREVASESPDELDLEKAAVDAAEAEAETGSQSSPSTPDRTFPFQSAPVAVNSSPLPAPNLIPPTTTPERLPQVAAGRDDPFASIAISPNVTVRNRPAPQVLSVPAAPPPLPAPSSAQTLPALPALEAPPLIATEPFPLIATPPVAPPSRLSEAIEISGVVEVGGKMSVIIHVPDERSSRYAAVGDYLANGKVLIKRVEMGAEPTVILEEDGVETIRYVGSSSSLAGLF
ncbi:hypothetical protein [Egbenema bharatensis]|uniref:hypothetical protein n=1 Tax=Egbenema bharatensis TaxID=3463334 RepID=UPI003A83A956